MRVGCKGDANGQAFMKQSCALSPTCVKLAAQNAKSMIMTIAKRVRKPALPVLPYAAKWRLNHPLHFLEESPALLRYAQPIYSLGLSVHK